MARWVLDTDGGVDDAEAVVLALSAGEEFKLEAITVVAGNVSLPQATKNIAECLRICNRPDIPLIPGADRSLITTPVITSAAPSIHGEDGLNNYWQKVQSLDLESGELPEPRTENAALEIIRLANVWPGELGIVTIGPLTNLAIALCLDETLATKLKRVVVMGGAPTGSGNVTVSSEFNIWRDPEAAYIVFDRLPQIELVSWELCIDPRHGFPADWTAQYTQQTTRKGRFIGAVASDSVVMCDPIAVAVAMHPEVALTAKDKEGWVELAGARTRGMTVINWEGSDLVEIRTATRRQLHIIETLDMEKIKSLLLASLRD